MIGSKLSRKTLVSDFQNTTPARVRVNYIAKFGSDLQYEQANSRESGRQATDCRTPPQDSAFFSQALGKDDGASDDLSPGRFVSGHYRRKELDDQAHFRYMDPGSVLVRKMGHAGTPAVLAPRGKDSA